MEKESAHKMDDNRQHDNGRQRMDFYHGVHTPWNMMPPPPQYQMNEANTALFMNKKIMHIIAEKDAAIDELNRAISDKNAALEERNEALKQRDEAISARDTALRERDSAIAALRFQESSMNGGNMGYSNQRGMKKRTADHPPVVRASWEAQITNAIPVSVISSQDVKVKRTKEKPPTKPRSHKKKGKKAGDDLKDLNRHVTTDGSKAEWEARDLGLIKQVDFDESIMASPVCSCTGVFRQCYKSGNGGWQSSCCTTTMSEYPLPQMPNKRHSRMGGRKMSGSVFTRLLSRLAADGHDLSFPVDLKNYWAKHGTNKYITIK